MTLSGAALSNYNFWRGLTADNCPLAALPEAEGMKRDLDGTTQYLPYLEWIDLPWKKGTHLLCYKICKESAQAWIFFMSSPSDAVE